MRKKVLALAVFGTALISIQAVILSLTPRIDLNNLFNYANPDVPHYIFSEEVHDREIVDEVATLGRVLFYDKQLSLNSSISCASCHKQEFAFGDTLVASPGFDEVLTERHSPRLVNLNFSHLPEVFWDMRAGHLDSLPLMVLSNSIEMGFSGEGGQPAVDSLVRRLEDVDYYETLFDLAYGSEEITRERVNLALTQFVRSIVSYDSKYDMGRTMVDSNTMDFPNFSALENKGKRLFLSDFGKELTIPIFSGPVGGPQGPVGPTHLELHPQWATHLKDRMGCADCHGIDNFTVRKTSLTGNNGIIGVIGHPLEQDTFVKRSPSLRDLFNPQGLEIGPYMHEGSLITLDEVLDHYAEIGYPGKKNIGLHPNLDVSAPNGTYQGPSSGSSGPQGPAGPSGNVVRFLLPRIDSTGKESLIAFMKTLSGSRIYTDEKWSDPFGEAGDLTLSTECGALPERTVSVEICQGETYDGYFTTGTHRRRVSNDNGCDSILITELVVQALETVVKDTLLCYDADYEGFTSDEQIVKLVDVPGSCSRIEVTNVRFQSRPGFDWVNLRERCVEDLEPDHESWFTYTDTIASLLTGCDSLYESYNALPIIIPQTLVVETLCEGEEYLGENATGIYEKHYVATSGCDSLVILDLQVLDSPVTHYSEVICEGNNIDGYTTTGSYEDVYRARNGCDSTRHLELLVHPITYSEHIAEICDGETHMGHSRSGYYEDIFVNSNGCDSVRQLDLTVLEHSESDIRIALCEGDSYDGYTRAGSYVDIFSNAAGCDSVRQLELTVLEHSASYDEAAICQGESLWGHDTPGLHTDMLINAMGCDSTRQLDLVILEHSESYEEIHLCPGEDFEGYASGHHEEYHTNAVGCDSIRYIDIVNIPKEDAVCVLSFDSEARLMSESDYLTAYPNPVVDVFRLRVAKPERLSAEMRIYDASQRLVWQQEVVSEVTEVDFSAFASGLYLVYLKDGQNLFLEKILKI